jgi:hypothetical protein
MHDYLPCLRAKKINVYNGVCILSTETVLLLEENLSRSTITEAPSAQLGHCSQWPGSAT